MRFWGDKKSWIDRQHKRMSSAALCLETPSGQLLIVKATYKDYWTLPGGIVDIGETPKQAAVRETFEETGIIVDPKKLTFVAVVDRVSSLTQTYQFVFKAPLDDVDSTSVILQASEIEAYAFVTKDQVRSHDRNYGQPIKLWLNGESGYIEQQFEKGGE